jgi:hypothetical protein
MVEESDQAAKAQGNEVIPTKKTGQRKGQTSSSKRSVARTKEAATKRQRRTSLFPASSFEESLTIPNAIQKHAAGQKVRRLTLFDQLQKSPDSGPSRQLITNANKYGLIRGNYNADYLELTPEGAKATSAELSPREITEIRFKLAIDGIPPFKAMYENLKGNRLPAISILEDLAREQGVPDEDAKECVEIFIVNAKYLGLLKPIAGAERIIAIEHVLEELGQIGDKNTASIGKGDADVVRAPVTNAAPPANTQYEQVCFYISPIGDDGSEHRIHSDLFLGSLIEPALEEFKLKVVRADKIGKPGMITAQIIEYILKSKLVIADLSFHNPNVFYELSLRHVCRLPTVQIIRRCDHMPFDLDQFRTIQIDTASIFTMVPNLQSYKAEIATQVRAALKDPDSVDNPLSTYYPKLRATF